MGALRRANRVKLIVGLLAGDADLLPRAAQLLKKHYGEIDLTSEIWPFTQTTYYELTMGTDLKRQFVAFHELIGPDELVSIKRDANAIEEKITAEAMAVVARPVNIDPGYIHPGKLVLASTKDNAHRIYIGASVYAEPTLRYSDGQWHLWPWTYPDYHQACYHAFFLQVRDKLNAQLRDIESGGTGTIDS